MAHNIEATGGLVPRWLRQWERWFQLQPVERPFAVVGWTLRLLGRPQPPDATPAAQARRCRRSYRPRQEHLAILRSELETGLFTNRAVQLGRARRASLMVLLHGLRARWDKTLAALDGRAVYSDTDFFHRPRG